MSIIVDGKEFAVQEVRVIDDQPTLVVSLGAVAPSVINGVEYRKFDVHVDDGRATLSIPFGEKLTTSTPVAEIPFEVDYSLVDEMDQTLERIIADFDAHVPLRPLVMIEEVERPLAEIVDIEKARARSSHPSHKRRSSGASRTQFTRRPMETL